MIAQSIMEDYCEDNGIDVDSVPDNVWDEVESQLDNMFEEILEHERSNGAFNLELNKLNPTKEK